MTLIGPIDSTYETELRDKLNQIYGGEISEEINSGHADEPGFEYTITFKQIATREMRTIKAGVNTDGSEATIEILEKGPWRS